MLQKHLFSDVVSELGGFPPCPFSTIFLAGVLLSLDPRLLAVREVDLRHRHLDPSLPVAGGSPMCR